MTCKDCVHCDACGGFIPTDLDQDVFEYCNKGTTDEIPDMDERCGSFKNKADFVEVKHGEWVRQKGRPEAICSECGREVVYQIIDNKWRFENFCPHCGADMRKRGADNG